jgi:O-antigen/teichoic acid export membrane protein
MNGQPRHADVEPDPPSQEVAERSATIRREELLQFFAVLLAVTSSLIGVSASIAQFLGDWRGLLILIIVAVISVLVALPVTYYFSRQRHQELYTYLRQIRDENLRELIFVVAVSQTEFERAMTLPNKSALPEL